MQEFFFSIIGRWSYLGLLLILLAAGFGVPIPEDIPLLGAGWLVYRGKADLTLMILTAMSGVLLGDSLLFLMGRRYGMRILERRFLRRFAKPWLLARARKMYEHHGAKILFAARFMPGLRAVVFMNAGIFHVPYWKFLLFDGSAAMISVPLWVWAGWKFSGHIEALLGGARIASYVIGGLLAAAFAVWMLWEYYHFYRRKNGQSAANGTGAGVVCKAPLVAAVEKPASGLLEVGSHAAVAKAGETASLACGAGVRR